jgi:demethylmenaquinone methyltransferase/2-methoxy-6-polyprenyl-1,4-benzoquinol methylase
MKPMTAPATPESMGAYYAQRAAIYERIFHKPERQADLRAMESWLTTPFAGRRVLEVACGTGWWTPHGARAAQSWLATDLNPETMAVAQHKTLPPSVRFATVDAYSFAELEGQRFDGAFAGFWWSHVALARLPGWLALLHERLEPGARVVLLDNRFVPGSSTPISRQDAAGNTYQMRTLDDGSEHEVLKNFPTRDEAFAVLGARARKPQWLEHTHYWILSYALA